MKYFIKIFGCQMNQSDAERIATLLEKYKFKPAASIDAAGLIIFVTCAVRQSAEDRVYGQINNLHKKSPEKKIVLTGCLTHRKDVQRRLRNKVDLFFRINDSRRFENWIIENCLKIENLKLKIPAQNNCYRQRNYYLSINPKYTDKYTAFVPVMSGCNNFCAYCVVPYARGREYSRPVEDILKEVKNLVRKGYKEIILLGQNVNSYRSQFKISNYKFKINFKLQNSNLKLRSVNFAKLLKLVNSVPGNFWLSFLTSHPKDMSDELIETIARSKKICEYISLPAQSGDNEILCKMNRHYTIEHYKNFIKKIRVTLRRFNLRPPKVEPSISTDLIVGFPGETKKQFENTAKLLREIKFDMAYIAQYSPRPETAAWRLKDNVSKKEKIRREKVLTEILKKTALENNKMYVGRIVDVLVDREIRKLNFRKFPKVELSGHTRTQKKVIFQSNKKIPIGSFVKVKIAKAKAFGLEGKII